MWRTSGDGHGEAVGASGRQSAEQWFVGGCAGAFLRDFRLFSEANAARTTRGSGEVLNGVRVTFLKSAIWEAYWEGVRLRLGSSASCPQEESPGKCSSLIN